MQAIDHPSPPVTENAIKNGLTHSRMRSIGERTRVTVMVLMSAAPPWTTGFNLVSQLARHGKKKTSESGGTRGEAREDDDLLHDNLS